MKTLQEIQNMIENNVEEYRAEYRRIRDEIKAIVDIYNEDRFSGASVKTTIEKCVDAIGYDRLAIVLASLINECNYDGRISDRNKEAAAAIEGAYDRDAARKLSIYTNEIHKAHLDQLFDAFRRFEKPADPAPAVEAAEMHETVITMGLLDKDTCKQEISDDEAQNMIDEILLTKYNIFAYTLQECRGCYKMQSTGAVVHEKSIRLEIVTESPLECLPALILDLKKEFNQESVMIAKSIKNVAFC